LPDAAPEQVGVESALEFRVLGALRWLTSSRRVDNSASRGFGGEVFDGPGAEPVLGIDVPLRGAVMSALRIFAGSSRTRLDPSSTNLRCASIAAARAL